MIKYIHNFDVDSNNNRFVIINICNNFGIWSNRYHKQLIKKFGDNIKVSHRDWYLQKQQLDIKLKLGLVHYIDISENTTLANIIGLNGVRQIGSNLPVSYEAIKFGLSDVMTMYNQIYIPKLDNMSEGFIWNNIESILKELLKDFECSVIVFDCLH